MQFFSWLFFPALFVVSFILARLFIRHNPDRKRKLEKFSPYLTVAVGAVFIFISLMNGTQPIMLGCGLLVLVLGVFSLVQSQAKAT
jgi:multisubunit Na+/H+ antiporter MnhB subunit